LIPTPRVSRCINRSKSGGAYRITSSSSNNVSEDICWDFKVQRSILRACYHGTPCTSGYSNLAMFSTLRFLQHLQPVLSSAWSQARRYTLPGSAQQGPSQSSINWDGIIKITKTSLPPVRTIDQQWEDKSSAAKHDLIQYPPANPYSGLDVLLVCDFI
jgi:hypothetical protein